MRQLFVFVVLFVSCPNLSAQSPGPWRSLFNGHDLSAWRGYRQDAAPTRGWIIEGNTLRHVRGAGGGDLITRDQFEDFEFRFDWRVGKGANSGVMYRVTEAGAATYHSGPEYQVLDDAAHGGADPRHQAAACYALYPAPGKTRKPAGEWNSGRIVIRQGKVEHWLNGVRVVAFEIGSEDWKARVGASKFGAMAGFGLATRGHLALQDHGDDVWYRNLKVREWPAPDSTVLFDGRSLDAFQVWSQQGDGAGVWTINDAGHLVCKGRPAGYLVTKKSFRNFVLELDWRWAPGKRKGRNSGVLCRLTGPDKIWPRSVEAQLMSGHAGDIYNIGDVPMTPDPKRTLGRRTVKLTAAERPIGEWNHYRITLDGGRFVLEINGVRVNEVSGVEEISGRIGLQSEGAEIHFRHIHLRELTKG